MNTTDLQLGGGYTYQWECAILLALNYFFEPVRYEPTLYDLVTGFLGDVTEVHLEGKRRVQKTEAEAEDNEKAKEIDLEDIALISGQRQILIQVKTKQADWGHWTLTEPLLRKALRHFYDSPLLTPESDDTRFVFLTNRPFNRDLVRIQKAIRAGTVSHCPEASRLLGYLQPEEEEGEEHLDPERFHFMLSHTSLVQYLPVDAVKANVQAKLQAYGRRDWEQTYALLFEHFSWQSTRLGGGTVNRESIAGVLGSQAQRDVTGTKPGVTGARAAEPPALVLWGKLPFPLADRVQPDQRRGRLDGLPATFDPAGTEAEWLPSLPPLPILSLDPGDRVERAFKAAGKPLKVVRTRHDVPARGQHSLLKLAGDLASRSRVVLSRAEIRELRNDADNRYLLDEARRAAEGGALLMVGCDPAGADFDAWWAALAPAFRDADLYALGAPPAPWPAGVQCLGSDLKAARAALEGATGENEPGVTYNIAAVRDLLLAGFTGDDLRRLALYTSRPELKPLIHEFGSGDGLSAMVEKAITFSQKQDCMADLLAEVEEANPRQYTRFKASLLA